MTRNPYDKTKPIDGCPAPDELAAYLEGALPPETGDSLARHLEVFYPMDRPLMPYSSSKLAAGVRYASEWLSCRLNVLRSRRAAVAA